MNSHNVIWLEVLLCLMQDDDETCSVSGMARALQREKYIISRTLKSMEEEGLVDRSDSHRPRLTTKGRRIAREYNDKVNVSVNHLLYEGVDAANARSDAMVWALYNSSQTMEVIRKEEARCRAKYELRNEKSFSGDDLCSHLPDGSFPFSFIIYRRQARGGDIISMANEGFEHPCILSVRSGRGSIQLRAVEMKQRSRKTGLLMTGSVSSMKYYSKGYFISVKRVGDILTIPASALSFVNIGSGIGQILHGSVALKMNCTVGPMHMPESSAVFTLMI